MSKSIFLENVNFFINLDNQFNFFWFCVGENILLNSLESPFMNTVSKICSY